MKVYLPNTVSNFKLYNEIIPKLSEYYQKGEIKNPIISFVDTEWINYESIIILKK